MEQLKKGRIVEGRGGFYTVREDEEKTEYILRAKGRFRKEKIKPLVGDQVCFYVPKAEEEGWIEEILPRRSQLLRPPAANIELMLITVSPSPMADLLLVDKMLVRARQENINCLLVYNKADLDENLAQEIQQQYLHAKTPFYQVSAVNKQGLAELKKAMRGKLCCMAGQSGVGKSTLLNSILDLDLETGSISKKIERGKHTTRHTTLIEQDGLMVLDTPGFSLLDLDKTMDPVDLQQYYPEFEPYEGTCYFQPCYHQSEPKCAVTKAVEEGEIHPKRMERYDLLLEETKENWRGRYD